MTVALLVAVLAPVLVIAVGLRVLVVRRRQQLEVVDVERAEMEAAVVRRARLRVVPAPKRRDPDDFGFGGWIG